MSLITASALLAFLSTVLTVAFYRLRRRGYGIDRVLTASAIFTAVLGGLSAADQLNSVAEQNDLIVAESRRHTALLRRLSLEQQMSVGFFAAADAFRQLHWACRDLNGTRPFSASAQRLDGTLREGRRFNSCALPQGRCEAFYNAMRNCELFSQLPARAVEFRTDCDVKSTIWTLENSLPTIAHAVKERLTLDLLSAIERLPEQIEEHAHEFSKPVSSTGVFGEPGRAGYMWLGLFLLSASIEIANLWSGWLAGRSLGVTA